MWKISCNTTWKKLFPCVISEWKSISRISWVRKGFTLITAYSDDFSLLISIALWSFHVRCSLNITSNNLTEVTLSIWFFLIVKTDSFDNVFVLRELNKMYFVFLTLRESLFAISQLSMFSSSLFPFWNNKLLFFALRMIVVSSAKDRLLLYLRHFDKSLM